MATTPPPPSPSALRVPAAPRHGAGYDQFSPYPTRYSARLASQRASRSAEKTPPEYPSSMSNCGSRGSPRKYRRVEAGQVDGKTLSPPGSSSNPRTDILSQDRRRFKGGLPSAHDPSTSTLSGCSNLHSSTLSQHHSLPTPAKTPSKKKISEDISSTSRTLFPTHSAMRAKKSTPFSLESFDTSESSKDIQIYTDSRDRVPKPSAFETPFNPINPVNSVKRGGLSDSSSATPSGDSIYTSNNEATSGEPTTAIRDRRAVARAADNKITMMFRGKKVYKYDEEEDDSVDDLGLFASRPDLLEANPELLNSVKPLRRADIKPRQLFPQKPTDTPLTLEAYADDDDLFPAQPSRAAAATNPLDPEDFVVPGEGAGPQRLTRSTARHGTQIEGTPAAAVASESQRRRNSPFDQWRRKKQNPEDAPPSNQTTPQKREARALSPTGAPVIKKTRSTTRQGRSA